MNDMISNRMVTRDIQLDKKKEKSIEEYMHFLMKSNKETNLISRKMTRDNLLCLIQETLFIGPLVSKPGIIDAGSGNGLLGVPLAILNKKRPVVLVETKKKKVSFLRKLKSQMSLDNIEIYEGPIEDYLRKTPSENFSLVTRGFPRLEIILRYLHKGIVREILVITAKRKMIKIKKGMESITQKIYNIPFRDNIVIYKMENVSRET